MLAEPQWAAIFGAAKRRGARWRDGPDVEAFKREVTDALAMARNAPEKSAERVEPPQAATPAASIPNAGAPGAAGGRRVSARGIALLHSFEQCRLDAYPDPGSGDGNPWTIGWGSTGPGIQRGTRWTQAQADARFEADLARFSSQVERLIGDAPTTQSQFDALVSLAYNIGVGALQRSTVLRRHKAGDFAGAARAFLMWNKNNGKVMRGLTRRRLAESELYSA